MCLCFVFVVGCFDLNFSWSLLSSTIHRPTTTTKCVPLRSEECGGASLFPIPDVWFGSRMKNKNDSLSIYKMNVVSNCVGTRKFLKHNNNTHKTTTTTKFIYIYIYRHHIKQPPPQIGTPTPTHQHYHYYYYYYERIDHDRNIHHHVNHHNNHNKTRIVPGIGDMDTRLLWIGPLLGHLEIPNSNTTTIDNE